MNYKPEPEYPSWEAVMEGWKDCKEEVWKGNPDTGAFASYVRLFISTYRSIGDW